MSQICDTPVAIEQITQQVNKALGTNASVERYECTQIGLDQGFLSKVVRIHDIVWSDGNPKLPQSIVVKIPQMDNFLKIMENMKDSEELQKTMGDIDMIRKATRCEGAIYEMFSKATVSPKLSAYYGSVMPAEVANDDKPDDGAPFILMEDLSTSHTADMMSGLTEKQFSEIAEILADVQAWSIINKSKWSKCNDFQWDISKFLTHQEKAFGNFRTHFEENDVMKRIWTEEFGDKLEQCLDEFELSDVDLVFKFDTVTVPMYFPDTTVPKVLVHGDCHAFNMLFDDSDRLTALIDWQVCHEGHAFEDIIRLMTSSPNDTARLEWWPKVFDQWHARLTEKLGDHHKLEMSKADLWKLYEIAFYYNSTMTVPSVYQMAGLSDGMIKGFVADIHGPQFLEVACRCMRDALEIKKKYSLK